MQRGEPEAPQPDGDDSAAVLKLIFDHAGEGISVFDAQLKLVAWNARFVELSGLPPERVVRGVPARQLLMALAEAGEFGPEGLSDAKAAALARVQAIASSADGVTHRVRPNGRVLEMRRNPIPGGGFVMLYQDITERRAAEARLADQQRMLTLLVERTEQGFWFIDNELNTTDANPAMLRMLGTTREQMLGRNIYEFVDEDNAAIFRYRTQLRAQGLASSYEIVLTRADGSKVPCWNNATPLFDANGRKAGALGMFSDISPLKDAEARVRHSEARFRRMADGAPALIWQSDEGGNPVWFNRRWLDQTGRSMATELALGWAERLHPEDLARCRAIFEQRESSPEGWRVEYRARRHDGGWSWIADHGIPLRAADGRLEGYVVHGWDITERKAAEAALIAARDEAERANRAKSDFLSRMSHELRTPLNAVLGFAQLLASDADDPLTPAQAARVHELQRGAVHLLSLINEVLDLSRIEAGGLQLQLAPVPLAALVGECLRMVHPMAEARGIALEVCPDVDSERAVLADPTRLKQVLLNLLSNAVKYNREQGRVLLSWHGDPADGHAVRIEVQDSGPGLNPAQQERLFQAFERLDAAGTEIEGAGIGLALSKWLVNLMRGEIGVDSAPGRGSTFWVRLLAAGAERDPEPHPPAATRAAAAEPAPPAQPAISGRRYSVLYVEDNPVNQLLMAGMLGRRPGIRLITAAAGPEGLALAQAERPDLVLLDIHLPGIDGYEVLRRLRRLPGLQGVPAIAVSANAMPSDIDEARAAGFDDYVTKPLDMPLLLAAVDKALERQAAKTTP
jgi:PAS domain S-box-containing protein